MTVTTYYPSPNGSYDALSVKRFSVGDTNGDGNINISDVPVSNGYLLVADKIGIRTTNPDAALKIESGGMAIGQTAAISDADGNNRSIQISTDTSYGGTYNDHTGALIFSIMPGGWGTSELHFRNSNNWSSYRSEDSMTTSYDTTYIHGNVGIGTVSPGAKLHLCGGDGSATFASAIIALGYSTTGQYPHFIHTRHNSGSGTGNAIDFYTGDQRCFPNKRGSWYDDRKWKRRHQDDGAGDSRACLWERGVGCRVQNRIQRWKWKWLEYC